MENNSLFVIKPYRLGSLWAFDDASRGLKQEPFVSSASKIIDSLIGNTKKTDIVLIFSAIPFPEYQAKLFFVNEDCGGSVYRLNNSEEECWLCPALLLYFSTPPKQIYVAVE